MPEETHNLTTKEYWLQSHSGYRFNSDPGNPISQLLLKYLPTTTTGTCLEIGSFPGGFLSIAGSLGYELNGIDFHPHNTTELPAWLQSMGFKTGIFSNEDFFAFDPGKQFDVVMSFGFIEHFENFETIILRHAELCRTNGYMVITAPNFKGFFQYHLHRWLDGKNLERHNLSAMDPQVWKKILEVHGFEILFTGYFGNFVFWVDEGDQHSAFQRKVIWGIQNLLKVLRPLLFFNSGLFSADAGVVARRK